MLITYQFLKDFMAQKGHPDKLILNWQDYEELQAWIKSDLDSDKIGKVSSGTTTGLVPDVNYLTFQNTQILCGVKPVTLDLSDQCQGWKHEEPA